MGRFYDEMIATMPPAHPLDPQVAPGVAAQRLFQLLDAMLDASRCGAAPTASLCLLGDRAAHVVAAWALVRGIEARDELLTRDDAGREVHWSCVKVRLPGGAAIDAHRHDAIETPVADPVPG